MFKPRKYICLKSLALILTEVFKSAYSQNKDTFCNFVSIFLFHVFNSNHSRPH